MSVSQPGPQVKELFSCSTQLSTIVGILKFISMINTTSERRIARNLFVFVALRPMSTAMVIAGRSVHLTTLFPGQA